MAKVPFSKLGVKIVADVVEVGYNNSKGEAVTYEVIKYLPFKDKLELISNVINQSIDENGFYNPMRVQMFTVLEIIYFYTNLTFTEKMKEDPFKLYDLLISGGIYHEVCSVIGDNELNEINTGIVTTIKNIYDHRNSVLGILEAVSHDYASLNLEANDIYTKLADPDNMQLLKSVVSKLG